MVKYSKNMTYNEPSTPKSNMVTMFIMYAMRVRRHTQHLLHYSYSNLTLLNKTIKNTSEILGMHTRHVWEEYSP